MNTATANLIDRKADFQVAVLDDDDAQMWVDARTLSPKALRAVRGEAPDKHTAAVCYYAERGELMQVDDARDWLEYHIGAYADTFDGLRDTLAKLTGAMPIPGVDNALTGQDRLDAWAVHLALYDEYPWFPFSVPFEWVVDYIEQELQDNDEATA